MNYVNPEALVSTEWLAAHLNAPDVRIIDGSFFLPIQNRDARQEYQDCHLPKAAFFDIDEVCDSASTLPHMLPAPEKFSAKVRKLGIGDGNRVVIYDATGVASAAARVWWMFRVFGHKEVSVLDGGLPKWLREGRPVEDLPPSPRERHFTARVNTTLVRSADQVLANIAAKKEILVDARAAGRFKGTDPEPRPSKKAGHIPGSVNLPFLDLIDPKEKTLLPADKIAERFKSAGVDFSKPVTASCGSGVTACVIALAAYLIGEKDVAVYDGSWAEWGDRDDTPVEKG